MDTQPDLSVVVLCYKAEESIVDFVEQLMNELQHEHIESYELILVANYDKGSKDRTPEIVEAIRSKHSEHIRIVAREKKGKMGWDMRSGMQEARGRYIAVIDGDGQMPVSDIPIVYNIIKTGRYDLVKTFRAKRFDGFFRTLVSQVYNMVFRMLFRVSFPVLDINSKPKIITKEALRKMQLETDDWFTDAEMMLQAYHLQLRVCQVSTVFYENQRRKSFVRWSTIFEFLYNLARYRLKYYSVK